MKNDEQEWRELCERAAVETDHAKLVALADKINQLLEKRENKLRPSEIKAPKETLPIDNPDSQ